MLTVLYMLLFYLSFFLVKIVTFLKEYYKDNDDGGKDFVYASQLVS